jgi:hypothetical protein
MIKIFARGIQCAGTKLFKFLQRVRHVMELLIRQRKNCSRLKLAGGIARSGLHAS